MVLWSRRVGANIHATDLKHWVGEKQPVPDVVQEFGTWTADGIELQDFLGGLGLAGAALPWDQDEVVVELRLHGAEDVVCQRITERGEREIWCVTCNKVPGSDINVAVHGWRINPYIYIFTLLMWWFIQMKVKYICSKSKSLQPHYWFCEAVISFNANVRMVTYSR